jgi:flagellar biosynthesis protein FlhB
MAEDTGGEKELPASPQKKRKAREDGNIAKSQDLSSGLSLALALFMLTLFAPRSLEVMVGAGRYFLGHTEELLFAQLPMRVLVLRVLYPFAEAVLPFAVVMSVGGLTVNFFQVGFLLTLKPLQPKFSRLNPISGFKKFGSLRTLMELFKSVMKVSMVVVLIYFTMRERFAELPLLMGVTPPRMLTIVSGLAVSIWWRVALAMIVLGMIDYGYQYWQHAQDLRMTHKEVKEEMKEMEGDPQVKRRIRQLQRQMATQRMMADVPEADVIITNPIRFAIALRYDAANMSMPVVTAKGARLVAARIREIAVENDVPIVQRPELARTMHRTLEIGEPIPENLFKAVAEVLSFVYGIDRRAGKQRERQAMLAKAS